MSCGIETDIFASGSSKDSYILPTETLHHPINLKQKRGAKYLAKYKARLKNTVLTIERMAAAEQPVNKAPSAQADAVQGVLCFK